MAPQSCCGSGTQLFETWDGQRSWPWTVPTLSLLRTVRCSVQIKEHWKGTCVEMEGKSGGALAEWTTEAYPTCASSHAIDCCATRVISRLHYSVRRIQLSFVNHGFD